MELSVGNEMKKKELLALKVKYIEIRNQIIQTIQNADFEIDVAGDETDKLQGVSLLRVQNQISQKNILKLEGINRAIDKIDDGDFGDCEECGESIDLRRLEVLPGVTLCVSCAEHAELYS